MAERVEFQGVESELEHIAGGAPGAFGHQRIAGDVQIERHFGQTLALQPQAALAAEREIFEAAVGNLEDESYRLRQAGFRQFAGGIEIEIEACFRRFREQRARVDFAQAGVDRKTPWGRSGNGFACGRSAAAGRRFAGRRSVGHGSSCRLRKQFGSRIDPGCTERQRQLCLLALRIRLGVDAARQALPGQAGIEGAGIDAGKLEHGNELPDVRHPGLPCSIRLRARIAGSRRLPGKPATDAAIARQADVERVDADRGGFQVQPAGH